MNIEGGANGALRIIGVSYRCAKHRHDAVTDMLVDVAAVPVDDAVGDLEILPEQSVGLLRVAILAKTCVAGQIGEQDRDLPAFADRLRRHRDRRAVVVGPLLR